MKGYIIKTEDGVGFLSKELFWFPHSSPEDAWVHPIAILEKLEGIISDWDHKPEWVFPAEYDGENTKVGEPFKF